MFNLITYSYSQFDNVDYAPEPQMAQTACRYSSSTEWYFSKQGPLWSRTMENLQMYL